MQASIQHDSCPFKEGIWIEMLRDHEYGNDACIRFTILKTTRKHPEVSGKAWR